MKNKRKVAMKKVLKQRKVVKFSQISLPPITENDLSTSHLYSQSARISIEMNNATIEEVLNEIEAKSEYYFLYNNKLINVDRRVSVGVDAEYNKNVFLGKYKKY